jgi:hypothetical protein
MLATTYTPDTALVGLASVIALLASFTLCIFAEKAKTPSAQYRIRLISIVGFLVFLFLSAADIGLLTYFDLWKARRFPDLSDYIGNHIFMAVGLVMAWHLFRTKQVNRYVGGFFLLLFLILILAEYAYIARRI